MNKLKQILTLGAILMPLAVYAEGRTFEEAQNIGEKFLQISNPKAQLTPAEALMTRSESMNYFAFNVGENNGYVIVSSDDRFEDILGYSDSGNFNLALENSTFKYWLQSISSEMETAVGNGKKDVSKAPMRSVSAPDIAPLLTTKWGQWAPYNNDCKETGSLRPTIGWVPGPAPTGCVATAMAQVMRYHKWPPAYTNGSDTYQYNWDLMVDSYDGSESEEAIDQVAKLMSHCGKSVNTYYESSQSGASQFNVPNAMVHTFGYDGESIRLVWRNSFGYDALHEMLYTELRNGRPIIAGGNYYGQGTADGGHEFLLDGCNSDGFFHVNWGWSGSCDGYFRLTAMQPSEYDSNYSFDMDFIIGIQPQKGEANETDRPVITPFGDLQLWSNEETVYKSTWMDDLTITTVNTEYHGFINSGTATFRRYSDKIICKFTDLDTGESVTTYDDHFELERGRYYTEMPIRFYGYDLNNLKENTPYKFTLHYQLCDDDTLYDMEFGPGRRSYFIVERIDNQLKITQPKVESDIRANFGNGSDRILRRTGQGFTVDFKNNSDTEYLGAVKCRFTDSYGNQVDALSDYIMLDLKPGESSSENFTLFNISQAAAGNYTMSLYDYRDKLISDYQNVELYDYKLEINASNFPDAAFREYVSTNFDYDGDGSLSESEIESVYQINLDGVTVKDFSGIGHFTNLYYFSLSSGSITHLDLSECQSLSSLSVKATPLESINISGNPNLGLLVLEQTNLTSLDLSMAESLTNINVSDNPLENLILPTVSNLRQLSCPQNAISQLDLSNQKKLEWLICWSNKLTDLDITGLEKLTYLDASPNEIVNIRMSEHPALYHLDISNNLIEGNLDVSPYPSLKYLYVYANNLSGLTLGYHPELMQLIAETNSISGKLDLSSYDKLVTVRLSNNNLDEIIMGSHPDLEGFNVGYNNLTGSLNLSDSKKLQWITAGYNHLNEIVLGEHPDLTQLYIGYNDIEGIIDISGMPNIEDLYASNNKISVFKYGNHPNLWRIILDNNALTHFHADDFPSLGSTYACYAQEAYATISTPNFNTKTLASTGFNPDRSSDWWAEWVDVSGEKRYHECSTINGVVMIPDEAGRDVKLVYSYLVDAANNNYTNFNLYLTREGFESGVDAINAENIFTVDGNCISFRNGIVGEVYTISGVCVYKGSGETDSLTPGLYIIRQGSFTTKVMIP